MFIKPYIPINKFRNIRISASLQKMTGLCRAWTSEELNLIKRQQNQKVTTLGKIPKLDIPFSKLSNKFLESIKRKYIFPFPKEDKSEIIIPYLQKKFDLNNAKKNTHTAYKDNILVHKRDLIKNIIGINTISHWEKVNNYKLHYNKFNLYELMEQKFKILNTFSEYLEKSSESYDFIFSKQEINRLKNLAAKYDLIEATLIQNKIYTKDIETLLFSNHDANYSVGKNLENRDIIIKKTEVYDKDTKQNIPALLTFADTKTGLRFKIYKNPEKLTANIDNIRKQFMYFLKTNQVYKINKLNKKIGNYLSNSEIAEVFTDINTKDEMYKIMEKCNMFSPHEIETQLENVTLCGYLHDLKNCHPDKYYNVSIQLINCLKDFGKVNNINKAFLEALAFGNSKHSPVALYIRNGCMPISENKEALEKGIFSKAGVDYTKNIWLKFDI